MVVKNIIKRVPVKSNAAIKSRTVRCISSDAKTLTHPIDNSSKVLRHLQFTKRIDYEKGLAFQEQFVRAQLDMKSLQSTIKQKLIQLEVDHPGSSINAYEKKILDNILEMKPNPVILTFEFDPVYTGGKRTKKKITQAEIEGYSNFVPEVQKSNPKPKFVQAERGGQVTFHGPGQMVAYIILDLKSFDRFVARNHVAAIEKATVNTLLNTKLKDGKETKLDLTSKINCNTGVWSSDDKKLASIGVHVRRSITSHGVCINVSPDLSYLNTFEMCGLPTSKASSIASEKPDADVNVQDVAVSYVNEFAKLLGIDTVERIELENLEID
ncbi:hypothetical protein Kpol_1064p55 [Vanderwaltozyma polyspora DSM 70294]|uniref:Octanoyltransferase n=1 Tax=Vanderwaltozyma polyspora (strain ATCC 22028 / DSM 70294 / BCRC 21397 / CBS 2163 / NBRC 10782 / NRRL Y-8283 / UCD 57-17) TaxID=436907 RepID=A7TMH9_VANPO|nr:uncharacterized protein Kpol_1064p55 [Vanderwaltozyma polyspora DSM 70294]EDO16573.1 hypothetical protein Kpol_1064p55 [Vanderwaltozyma polyspora DSM 70294]